MSAHKLAARSTACVFLGYPSSHKGYRRLDLSSRRIIISRHIVFDESIFPFTSTDPIADTSTSDSLLDVDEDTVHCSTNPAAVHSHGHPPVSVVAPPPQTSSNRSLRRPLRLLLHPLGTWSGHHLQHRLLRHTVVALCPRAPASSSTGCCWPGAQSPALLHATSCCTGLIHRDEYHHHLPSCLDTC
jgi:hypothetical protein